MKSAPTNATDSSIDNWDPILISLVRQSMPNLIAYDVCGVQPMTGPTGLIFAMRARAKSQAGAQALFDEEIPFLSNQDAAGNTGAGDQSGTNPAVLNDSPAGTYTSATGMTTAQAEALGDTTDDAFAEMAFSIEKHTVTAVSRLLNRIHNGTCTRLKQSILRCRDRTCKHFISRNLNRDQQRSDQKYLLLIRKGAQVNTTNEYFDLDTDSNVSLIS